MFVPTPTPANPAAIFNAILDDPGESVCRKALAYAGLNAVAVAGSTKDEAQKQYCEERRQAILCELFPALSWCV